MASLGCTAGQLQVPIRITINMQPAAVVCIATTLGATVPSINCVGGAPQSAPGDWGELSSRLVAIKGIEYIETTVSW